MRINTQFTVAVHILTRIAMLGDGERPRTSEQLAKSVGTNPVVIRRIVAQLRVAGLLKTRPGAAGAWLTRTAAEISLCDVYHAVTEGEDSMVFDVHMHPCPECCVGSHICEALSEPLTEAQRALEQVLEVYTLADMADYIRKEADRLENGPE